MRKCKSDIGQRPEGSEGGRQTDTGMKSFQAEGPANAKALRREPAESV